MDNFEDINWFGHASFSFVDNRGNRIYYVDPFDLKPQDLAKADTIFITHAHPDHFSLADIDKLLKPETVIVATPDVLAKIDLEHDNLLSVSPDNIYNVKGFEFKTVPAYNNHPAKLQFHPRDNNWVGYIFNINDKKVYHAGDTDFIDEMMKLTKYNLDIALLPIDGTYTMDYIEAAQAANAIAAKITIPIHYRRNLGESYPQVEEEFSKLVTNSKVVILPEISE